MPQSLFKSSIICSAIEMSSSLLGLSITYYLGIKYGNGLESESFLIIFGFLIACQQFYQAAFLSFFNTRFIEVREKHDEEKAWAFANNLFVFIIAFSLLTCLVFYFLSYDMISLLALGYNKDIEQLSLLVVFFKSFLPYLPVLFIISFFRILLQVLKNYIFSYLLPFAVNFFALIYIFIKTYLIDSTLSFHTVISQGFAISGFFFAGLTFIGLYFRTLFLSNFCFSFYDVYLFIKKTKTWIASELLYNAIPIIERSLASYISLGSVYALDFSKKVISKLMSVYSNSVVFNIKTNITEQFHLKKVQKANLLISQSFFYIISLSLFIMSPLVFVLDDLSQLFLLRGRMTEAVVNNIGQAMFLFSVIIFLQNINNLLTEVYISMNKVKQISLFRVIEFISYLLLIYLLASHFSFWALPLSQIIINTVKFIFYFFYYLFSVQQNFIDFKYLAKIIACFVILLFSLQQIEDTITSSISSIGKIVIIPLIFFILGFPLFKLFKIKEILIMYDKVYNTVLRK